MEKYGTRTRISMTRSRKENKKDEQFLAAGSANEEMNPEPFELGSGMRQRLPGVVSKRILQDEAKDGQPVMRSTKKPLSPEDRTSKHSIFWPGFSQYVEEDDRKSISSNIKVTKWDTADLHRGEGVMYIILAVSDFVLYAIYLATLIMLVFGSHDYAYNYYATTVSDILTKSKFKCSLGGVKTVETFHTVKTPHHIWCFLEEVVLPFLYPQNESYRRVLIDNALVGAPALMQVRVKNDSCRTPDLFKDVYKTCYDYYSGDIADRDTFGDGSMPFRWRSSFMEIQEGALKGRHVQGGYQFNFTTDHNFTKHWIEELQNQIWIRQGARFVMFDFALYTHNTNLFLIVKLNFELYPAGGVAPKGFFYTWKILRYVRIWDFFVMSCEIINVIFVLYFTFEEGLQMWLLGGEYLTNWWNLLDITIILTSYTAFVVSIWRFLWSYRVMEDKILKIGTNNHANFDELIEIENLFINVGSILLFFAWIKVFKFTTLFKSVTLILTSIERVIPELTFMFFMAIVISTGFAILGQNLFGEHIIQFSTITSSFISMVGIYVGRMHFYRKCLKTHPIIGLLFFGSFIILVCMLHLNAFVGLIVHGYREAHNLLNEEPQRQYLGDLVFSSFIQFLMRLGSDRLLRKLMMRDIVQRRQLDYDEFVLILKRRSVHGLELRMLLAHYGLKRGNEMSIDNYLEIYNDVLIRHQLLIESEGHNNTLDLIEKADRVVSSCEVAVLDVQTKVDILIDKLLSESSKEILNRKKKKKKDPLSWF